MDDWRSRAEISQRRAAVGPIIGWNGLTRSDQVDFRETTNGSLIEYDDVAWGLNG